MDLEERIARLIDPDAWATADISSEWGLVPERYEQKSRAAARRVIDGLGLRAAEFVGYDYEAINIFGQIPKEDT